MARSCSFIFNSCSTFASRSLEFSLQIYSRVLELWRVLAPLFSILVLPLFLGLWSFPCKLAFMRNAASNWPVWWEMAGAPLKLAKLLTIAGEADGSWLTIPRKTYDRQHFSRFECSDRATLKGP
jgi:hypothetical protein